MHLLGMLEPYVPESGRAQETALIRGELDKILQSPEFVLSERSRLFLRYVVEETLAGRADEIKEYSIAVEVFGRKDSYDSREHSAVRVEAARLRARLAKYYESNGADAKLIIELPKGRYVPQFRAVRVAVPPAPERPTPFWKTPLASRVLWAGALLLAIGAATAAFLKLRQPSMSFQYRPVTELPGPERYPSLSPAGDFLLYAKPTGKAWHIFLQRTGGTKPMDLTPEAEVDNIQPVFSPDGSKIAFRSERDGGGIFIMGATGESVKRVSPIGYNPSWSPDSKFIVVASEPVLRAEQRLSAKSSLSVIEVATGQVKTLFQGDAVQPMWSPNGKRIAFWAVGQNLIRDIWTIAADGTDPKRVTNDPFIDWCPVWGQESGVLYYLSDKGGATNLWRVKLDEADGEVLEQARPETTPAQEMSQFSIAMHAPKLAYENRLIGGRVAKLSLVRPDSELSSIITLPPSRQPAGPDLSRDGQWLVYYSLGNREDIYIVRTDGTGARQLTDDTARDRGPRWAPDGKTVAFTSDRSGRREIWSIRTDGTGLKQMTHTTGPEPVQVAWSADGTKISYYIGDSTTMIADVKDGVAVNEHKVPAPGFMGRFWSEDGRMLMGSVRKDGSSDLYVSEYRFQTNQVKNIGEGSSPTWSRDGKFVFYSRRGTVWKLHRDSGREERVYEAGAQSVLGMRPSLDMNFIYFSLTSVESDIWLREGNH